MGAVETGYRQITVIDPEVLSRVASAKRPDQRSQLRQTR
jgi:hypothetical protein